MGDIIGFLIFVGFILLLVSLSKIFRELQRMRKNQDWLVEDLQRLRNQLKANSATPVSTVVQPPAKAPPPLPTTPHAPAQPVPIEATMAALSAKRPPIPAAAQPVPPRISIMDDPLDVEMPAWMNSAQKALHRIWNWILMGSEERPAGVTLEYAIGTTWLVRGGIGFLVLVVGYFLKLSIEKGLLSDTARVVMTMVTGVAMLVTGMRMLNKKYQLIGQGLVGGGILALYFSAYAAGPMYYVVSMPIAFGLMVFLTLIAGIISVRIDSLLVAVIGLAGGYGTPLIMHMGLPRVPALQAYVILLTLGVLGVAVKKHWRLLNYLSFILSYVLVGYSMDLLQPSETPILLGAIIILFLLHASITCVYNMLKEQESTTLEVVQTTLNALACAWFGYHLIQHQWGHHYPAFLSLGLALFYAGATTAFLRRRIIDRPLLTTLMALAGGFTVWTLPLWLEKESLTIALSILALAFVWIGGRLGSRFLTVLGNALYAVTLFRVAALDMPRNYEFHQNGSLTWDIYWQSLCARFWTFAIPIVSFFAACRVKRSAPLEQPPITPDNDVPVGWIPAHLWEQIFYWTGVACLFVFLHLEFHNAFGLVLPLRPPALTALWCAAAGFFLWQFTSAQNVRQGVQIAVAIFMTGAILKLLIFDFHTYRLGEALIYNVPYTAMSAMFRLFDVGLVLVLVAMAASVFTRRANERSLGIALGYIGLALLFLCSSLELNTLLHWKLPDFQQGGISAWWGTFAIALIAIGIWKNIWVVRLIGLILMVVVVGKVLLLDLADMLVIYRVVAFMILGVVMLIGAFAYIKAGRKFQQDSSRQDAKPPR